LIVKVAVTFLIAVMVTMHWLEPLMLSQPAHTTGLAVELAAGVAVRVTDVP
jgi:hypothetical protein